MNRNSSPATAFTSIAFVTLGLGAALAHAGVATLESADGEEATFEYRDDLLRINNSRDASSYAVVRDGSLFTVSFNNGQPMVIDAGSVMKGMSGMGLPAGTVPSDLDGKLISFEDTGDDETIAGIKGDVWEVVFEEADGTRDSSTMVLSTDKRAVEFSEAMFGMMNFAAGLSSNQAQEQGREFRARLEAMDAGVLRFGEDMKIKSLTSETVAMERFELPAKPMNLDGFGSMLKNLQQQQQQQQQQQPRQSSSGSSEQAASAETQNDEESGNLFSSMMGALSGGNKDDADAETEEKKENPVSKAFGRFFKKDKDNTGD